MGRKNKHPHVSRRHKDAAQVFAKERQEPVFVVDRSRWNEGCVVLWLDELEDDDIPNILYGALP